MKRQKEKNKNVHKIRTGNFNRKIAIVLVLIVLAVIVALINKDNISQIGEKLGDTIKKFSGDTVYQTENDISSIDLTGLVTGDDVQHTHIYEKKYDDTYHWDECFICGDVQNKEEHHKTTSGTGTCGTYLTDYCTDGCGYSVQTYVDHEIEYFSKDEIYDESGKNTNTNTYFHQIGKCKKCGSVSATDSKGNSSTQGCYDSEGKRISCDNRGICSICGYDYFKLQRISHHSTSVRADNKTYYCAYCNKDLYKVLYSEAVQDKNNNLHWTMRGIYQLLGDTAWAQTKDLYTWSELLNSGAFEKLEYANVTDLPNEYYSNEKYGTEGISSGLYMVQYEAYIKDGYQGTPPVRMNADNCFGNVNGNPNEYGKTYAISYTISPDTEAPTINNISINKSEIVNGFSQKATITVDCYDSYSDTLSVALYDLEGNCIADYGTATSNGDKTFTRSFDIVAETKETETLVVKAKDRYGNETSKNVDVQNLDAKAPTLLNDEDYTKDWSKNKLITFNAEDLGVGEVQIAFNNADDYQLATKDTDNYTRTYNFYGDVYDKVTAAVYLKDGLGNQRMVKVDIGKLDNTAPTISNLKIEDNKVKIEANDIHETLGEGSGVIGYRYITSLEDTNEKITEDEGTYIEASEIDLNNLTKARYLYVAPVDRAGNIGTTEKIELPTYSYTVNYYEDGGTTKLSESKVVTDKLLGEEITEKAIEIEGYNKIDPTSKTITINLTGNEINFYYAKRTDLSYTVKYLEQGTNEVVHEEKTETNQVFGATVTENAIDIPGYRLVSNNTQNITIKVQENEIIFYYEKRDDLSYKVEYYYDGIKDESKTETYVGTFKQEISEYEEKLTEKYKLDRTENLPLTISAEEENNVIKVYYVRKETSVIVHHYIEGTETKVPSKNGGVVEDETITGKVDDKYNTSVSSSIANNYELATTPANASGTMTIATTVVTYFYRLKDPNIENSNITKNSSLSEITDKNQEIPYSITYTVNVGTYIGNAEVTIVDTLPYKIDTTKSDIAGGTYDETSKTITWKENITDIDTFTDGIKQIAITKEIKLVYKDIDVNETKITNSVTGKIDLETTEKTNIVETNTDIATDYFKDIKVTKIWNDNNNSAGKRPTSVTVVLTGNGKTYKQSLSDTNDKNTWEYTFADLPKYDTDGNEIDYVLSEESLNNKFYVPSIDQENKTITNTFTVPDEKVSVKITKVWNDNNNSAQKRPANITIKVAGNKTENIKQIDSSYATKEDSNIWEYTFTDLPKYDVNGNEITYTIDEQDLNSEFYIKSSVNQETRTIVNTFQVPGENIEIPVTKVWDDNNNVAQKRPTSVTLQIKNGEIVVAEETVTESDGWKHTFSVPKYDVNGDEIKYTIDEADLNNKFYTRENTVINQENKTITNKFVVPDEKTTVTVTKIWDDNNNEAKKRPTSVTLQVKNGTAIVGEATVTEKSGWKHDFTLTRYDANGNDINYTVDEADLNNKYYAKGNVDQTAKTITNVSKYGKVVVHYYIMNTDGTTTEMKVPDVNGNEIADSIVEGAQGEEYTTNPATNVKQNYELVETPTNATGTITAEDTEVTYYYRLKTPNITNQNITKTGTDRITVANQEMSYTVTYTATVTDYIGNAEVTIVDTLPYEIDEEKSDLAGGTYNSASKTITWKENVSDINSYTGNGTVNVTKTFKVVYVDLDMNQEKVVNNVKGNIKLQTPEKTSDDTTSSAETPIYKAIISSEKLVDKTEAIEGEKVTYTIRIKNDGNLAKTVTVRDTLPAGITFDKDTLIQVGDTGTVYTEQNLKNGIPVEVPAYGSIDVVFAGKVDTLANNEYSKTLTNQATVDNEPTNEVTTEVTKANITAHKESDPISGNKVREGDEITYRIKVRNDGTRAGDVIVKDTIPAGTTFVEGSIKIDNVADSTKTANDLANGISVTVGVDKEVVVEFKVKVNKLIDGTKIKNTAYINQNGEDKKVPEEPEHTYVEPKEEQSITKNGTSTIDSLDQEITYNISYTARITDYSGKATVKLVDNLPYAIDEAKSDLAGGTYDAQAQTITWEEVVEGIQLTEEKEVTINKTIKVVYTGISQETTAIKNVVTGHIEYETPEVTSDEVTANWTTTTGFIVNIPVSKVWEDDGNKLGQRPTKVVFKLHGSDGSEYTKEMSKPGTAGSTTTQDANNPNKWNDIFENLPKYDENKQEIVYTLTEEEKKEGDLKYYDSVVTDKTVTNTNKYGKVTIHHYIMNTDGTTTTTRVPNAQGQEVQDVVIEGKEGAPYTTEEAKNINEKYELVAEKLPANAIGTIEKYNEEKPQEVIYYYRLKPAKVLINYLEKDNDTDNSNNVVLSSQEQITGYVDNSYNTDTDHRKETIEKDGKTYTLVSDSGNKTGNMTLQDITVTYYYLQNTKATVRYVERDPETHETVKDLEEPYTQEGLVGDKFVTNSKDFVGYKLVESPEKTTIEMAKEEQTLIYYYEPVYTGLIENHIDDKTGKVLYTETHDVQVGEDYDIPSKEFEGYDLVEEKLPENAEGTMGEELVTVNYYYIKKAVLEVNYLDVLTNEPLTEQIVDETKHEGDSYTTEEKAFENYDMIRVEGNKEGTLTVETDEEGNITNNRTVVTYYYSKKSAGVEEHHIDIRTGEELEEPTLHEGHVGDEYNIKAKEFLSYVVATTDKDGNNVLPENATGTMTEEKIVVNYYYNQPAKVIVHYVEKATGKELEEINPETGELQNSQVVIEGFNQDEYETTAKEFEYYTLIESPEEPNGTMKVEIVKDEEGNDIVNNTIELYYYYEAKPFNIGVEKEITGIIVNGERRAPTNGKLEKVEIYRKSTESTSVQVEYKIKVSNTGEVRGNATIEENIPAGMSLANNDGTWEEQEGKLIKVIPEIGAGETKEYTVLLNWKQTGENMGEKANEVKLVETGNVPGFVDNNDKDNTSNANVIISVETGELPIGLILALVALVALETVTLRYAVVLTKRQKKKVTKK